MAKAIKTKEDLKLFWDAFHNVYGEGIYIKADLHPCGWDYVDLSFYYDVDEMMEMALDIENFSYGYYDWHPYVGFTPFEMLKAVGENWCFERNQIDWV